MTIKNLDIPDDRLADFCREWKIVELSLFGSVLREDFGPGSDVDVLIEFAADSGWSLSDITRMCGELERMLGRPISIIERRALMKHHNGWLRHEILSTARQVYAVRQECLSPKIATRHGQLSRHLVS